MSRPRFSAATIVVTRVRQPRSATTQRDMADLVRSEPSGRSAPSSLTFPEAIKITGRPQVNTAIDHCGGGVDVLVKASAGEDFPVALGAHDRAVAALAEQVDLAIASDR